MSASPSPQFNANDEEKLGACLAIMPLVFDTLSSFHPGTDISADDIIDFHALCIAATFRKIGVLRQPMASDCKQKW